jgi:hypothetical protein
METDKRDNYDLYLHKWEGEPANQGDDTLISRTLVKQAVNRNVDNNWNYYSIGVDPARYGDDESVVCWRRGLQIQPLETFQGINTTELTGRILQIARRIYSSGYKQSLSIKVDDTGIGAGVTDQLQEAISKEHGKAEEAQEFNISILPVINNGKTTEAGYKDYGTQIWGEMRKALETISIPGDTELISQITTRKYKIEPDGKIKLERKQDMKKRGLDSPDRADALALCLINDSKFIINEQFSIKKR